MARTTRTSASSTRRIDGVLVIGGGYAGVHAARAAAGLGAAVTIVDPTGDYDFLPRLAAVAGGTQQADAASAPITEFLPDGVDLVIGRVAAIDDGAVDLTDGGRLAADAVVITAGAVSVDAPVPGIEHAYALRTADHARSLRRAIADAAGLIVIGGGATGVQLAGAAAHAHRDLDVTLVERDGRLLGSMDDQLGDHASSILRDRGVEVLTSTEVTEIRPDGATVRDDGVTTDLDGVVVWAAGVDARAEALGAPTADGRIEVDEYLRLTDHEATFAAGDVARHVEPDGTPLPASAQVAVRAGSGAGRNAARLVMGEELRPVRLSHQGWVLDLGGGRGVARLGPLPAIGSVPVSTWPIDRFVPLLHGAIDAKHLQEIGGLSAVLRHRPD